MSEPAPKSERCPYCGCGFEPVEPGQAYCSPFCEYEDRKRADAEEAPNRHSR